jgi:DNA-binding HxlR family transcriptional regulator
MKSSIDSRRFATDDHLRRLSKSLKLVVVWQSRLNMQFTKLQRWLDDISTRMMSC